MLYPVMFGAKEFRQVPSDDKDVSRMALTMPTAEFIALNPALEGLWRAQAIVTQKRQAQARLASQRCRQRRKLADPAGSADGGSETKTQVRPSWDGCTWRACAWVACGLPARVPMHCIVGFLLPRIHWRRAC